MERITLVYLKYAFSVLNLFDDYGLLESTLSTLLPFKLTHKMARKNKFSWCAHLQKDQIF